MHKRLQSQTYLNDPLPFIREWQAQGPFIRSKIPILGKVWFTTNQAAAAAVLKNHDMFSVRKSDGKVVGTAWWMPRIVSRLTNNMLASDEPEHTRLRGVADHAFQRRAIGEMDAEIQAIADRFCRALPQTGQPFDLIETFARPFPLAVICQLLGLPDSDHAKFAQWAQGLTNVTGVVSFLFAINKLKPLTRYIENRIALEREQGGFGLIHEMVNGSEEALSDDELVATVFLILLAGHETTTHLISGGVYMLLKHPDQLALLRSNPELIDLAVEELLRFVSPVQMTKPRYVGEDCMVEGVRLSKGDLIMPLLVAANFDPVVIDNPERFDIRRRPNKHMQFGTGVHFCLGHQLARAEMKAALRTLLCGEISLKLNSPSDMPQWRERLGMRSLKALVLSAGLGSRHR